MKCGLEIILINMPHQTFDSKWKNISEKKKDEEFSIFVPPGKKPKTQRQFNLFNYHEFIKGVIKGRGYKDAIEIGCGRGTIALYLRIYEKLSLVCNDNEESAINLAKNNFTYFNADAKFVVSDASNLGLPDESLDMSVSIGLLEHLPNYDAILKEQFRVLKSGGVMISLNIPKKNSVQILNNLYRAVYRFFKPSYPLKPDYYRNSDMPADYIKNALSVGFKDVYTVNVNPFPLFTPLHPVLERVMTPLYRTILFLRRIYLPYPFKTSYSLSQAHFLVGFKK